MRREAEPGGYGGNTLEDEIDAWEREQARQQRAFEEEQAAEVQRLRDLQTKEAAIMSRLFGAPDRSLRPPTQWAKPATHLQFFAESEFLRRTPRLAETVFAPEPWPEEPAQEQPPDQRRRALTTEPTFGGTIPGKKPRTPSLRRSRSSLDVIAEHADEERAQKRDSVKFQATATTQSTGRGLSSQGSRGNSRSGTSRPSSTDARGAVRSLLSAMKGSFARSTTPQTPQMDRKYGELVEASASAKSWGWASVSGRSSSRNGVHTKTDNSGGHVDGLDSSSRPFLWTAGSAQSGGGDKTFSPSFSYDRLVVDEPKEPTTPGFKVEKVKLFNSKTLKWVAAEQTDQASKDEAGHGDTVYPRIPQVFKDPAQTLADALLHAKTPDERRMILDQIANELRPGSFQASMVDFEASVGLVLTDDFHGPMVELIEAGSSAADSKKILRGDYIIEVNDTEVINRGADEVESMLIGKENTTVTVTLRTDHFGRNRSVTLMRKSLSGDLKQAPNEFFRKEEELMWGFGYNEFGALNQGQYSDTSAPVLCEKKKMAKWELKGRIQQVACGWYHTVVVGKQKWYTAPPAEYNKDDLKDPEFLSTEEIAAALAQWATPKFRKTARRDIELPDDAGELMELFDRKEIVAMYMRMVEARLYGSAKKWWSTFTCGLNKSGQLGHGDREKRSLVTPIESLIGHKVDLVACGGHHTLLLMQTGAVLAFGENRHGQLGNGTVFNAHNPQIIPALTHESTRNALMPTPSRVLIVTNLESYIGSKDIERNFKTCFGYQLTMLRGRDKTTVPGNDVDVKAQPCALVFFMDIITAAHAMKKFQGKVAGEQFTKLPMIIYYFHPHQAGQDWMAWLATKAHRSQCLIPIGSYVKQIAAGYDHSMALLTNGQVVGFGHNHWGQLGMPPLPGIDPEIILRMTELPEDPHHIQVLPEVLPFTRKPFPGEPGVGDPEKVKLMAVGGNHNLFLLEDGRVYACGRNDNLQLGLGSSAGKAYHQSVEVIELNKYDVRTVVAGASHSLAVLYDGRVLSWGRNDNFQCGHFDRGTHDIGLPREIEYLTQHTEGKPVVRVVANEHTVVTGEDYQVFIWGLNANGQLGLAHHDRIHRSIERPSWTTKGIRTDSLVGAFHTFVFNRMPLVSGAHQYERCGFSWGYNKHGELGLGYATEAFKGISVGSKTPALITFLHMREVELWACGWYHTLCIYHDQRDLRHNIPPPSSHAEPEDGMPAGMARSRLPQKPIKREVEEDNLLTMILGKKPAKQHLVGWGYNRRGQLGLGHSEPQCKPVSINLEKWGVETRVVQMSCGGMSSYIVTENREVFAFGNNSKGQLGNGEIGGRQKTPVKINKLCGKHVKRITAGYDHCFALVINVALTTELYSWGANSYGQLGLGHGNDIHTPTYVKAFSKIHPHSVACGGQHTIAVTKHSVWSCGRNDFGQLGLSHRDSTETSPPIEIKFLSHATTAKTTIMVACGASHSLFVLANGELLGCGRNDSGQLGLGHFQEYFSKPTWILTEQMLNGHQVIAVTASDHTLVSLSNGEIIGCGQNHNGQLGLGHTMMTADFQTLPLDSIRADVRAGAFHTLCFYGGPHPRREKNASAASAAVSGVCSIS